MAKNVNNIQLQTDLSPISKTAGMIEGVTLALESDIYINYFINYGLDQLRSHFNKEFLLVAMGNPGKYHHVFEWNTLGTGTPIPLYKLRKMGKGRSRALSYDFLQSRRQVPLPKDLDLKGHTLRRHIFRFKALVMETGSPVVIRPKNAKKLLIPSPDSERGFYFANKSVVRSPGGASTTGAFTSFWQQWFSGRAEQLSKTEIAPRAESHIRNEVKRGVSEIRMSKKAALKDYKLLAQEAEAAKERQKVRMETTAERWYHTMNDEGDD